MLYLTPVAIGYLTQLILIALITAYFLWHFRFRRSTQLACLIRFLIGLTGFIATLFLEAALLPPAPVLVVVFLQAPLLSVAWVCLLQFAYRFPTLSPPLRREARLSLVASGLYALWEIGFALYRFVRLRAGVVEYRIDWTDYLLLLFLLWAPIVFIRQMYRLTPSHERFWRRIRLAWLRPAGREAHALRTFTLIFLFVASLSLFNLLRTFYLLSVALANLGISLGILAALFAFALTYLDQRAETTSFMVKLAGVTLTVMLALMGIVGWVIAPARIADYRPDLVAPRALRFTPAADGGYTIAEIPFAFERDLGRDLQLDDGRYRGCSEALTFDFPFYGQNYPTIYACNDGVIAPGRAIRYREYQYRYGAGVPLLMPLLMDLDPNISPGGVFARQEADRLIITWDRLRGFRQPEAEFTFQVVLYADGRFDFVYAALSDVVYYPNDEPGASLWAVGAIPGNMRGPLPQGLSLAALPATGGPDGVVQDFLLEFRQHLHRMLAPLAGLILAASVFIVGGFPLMFYVGLVQPLNDLVAGVERIEAGEYATRVPVRHHDEIGFLTRAFNALSAELGDLIRTLEERVAERTADLDATNAQLRAEIVEREQAQATIIEQQRALADLEAREGLARDLHDGLGQVMGYINVQAQAVQTFLDADERPAAQRNLADLIQASQEAHRGIRAHILGLREPDLPQQDFIATVRDYLHGLGQHCDLVTTLSIPDNFPPQIFTPAVEEQALHILQEGLTNVRKHAQAHRVDVVFRLVGDYVQISVEDNGCGFEPKSSTEADLYHFGLRMMRERAERAGGELEVRSWPGRGTRLMVTLPRFVITSDESEAANIQKLRVLLVDDHPLFLDGLRNLLIARGITVIGVAHDGREAQEKVRALRPDVVVMDLNMPKCDGLAATRAIKAEFPETKIVILTVAEEDDALFEAIKSGASGYLLKNLEANEFCRLLTGLLRDEIPLAQGMAARVLAEFSRMASQPALPPADGAEELSSKQWEILGMVVEGMLYKEIAADLNLSENTIKYHMSRILELLHLENRAQAIAYYQQLQEQLEEDTS